MKEQSTEKKIEATRYSSEDLKEFEEIILKKLEEARNEVKFIKESLLRRAEVSTDSFGNVKMLEDGAETAEKENLNQLAVRQQKFIKQLESALIRIKNGTYGVCVDTGKLIPKARLRLVPHTRHSVEAKNKRR